MNIYTGTPREISDSINESGADDETQFWFNALDLEEKNIYIAHVYVEEKKIDVFPKFEDGTPMVFISQEDENIEKVWDPTSYVLPALYGMDKKNKERIWKIWAVKDTVYKIYGESKGLKTPSSRSFKGMNIGKKNATTAEEQAKREAERDWVKQLEKGYHPKSKEGLELEKKVILAKKKQGGVNVNIDEILRGRNITDEDIDDNNTNDIESLEDSIYNYEEDENDILPMHCQVWSMEPKCLKYFDFESGVYIQPKLDGVRCLAKIRNGRVVLSTRSGKDMVWLNHIREEVKLFLSEKDKDLQLDCEVYAHCIIGTAVYNENKKNYSYEPVIFDNEEDNELENLPELEMEQRFDVISGAARPKRNEPHPLESQLCLYVFDIADPTGELDQDSRFEILKRLFSSPVYKSGKTPHIKRVETKVIYYPEEVEDYHDEVSEKDYEGVVLRSRDLYYESKNKSLSMRKHKHFIDEEYPITDVACNEGVGRENFRWVCEKIIESPETGENILTTFQVKPMGTREQRWNWYDNSDDYLGKLLNVRYQKLTYEGVPRFPRGTHVRDYDDL